MIDPIELQKIKEATEEFLQKMTLAGFSVATHETAKESDPNPFEENFLPMVRLSYALENTGSNGVNVDITLQEPQFLIGQGGQTLFDLQRLLKIILNKKLQKAFYIKVDINGYKKKKVEYLKSLAKEAADEVAWRREEKALTPMAAYERRIVHMELAQRSDVKTESRGNGPDRHLVIRPR